MLEVASSFSLLECSVKGERTDGIACYLAVKDLRSGEKCFELRDLCVGGIELLIQSSFSLCFLDEVVLLHIEIVLLLVDKCAELSDF